MPEFSALMDGFLMDIDQTLVLFVFSSYILQGNNDTSGRLGRQSAARAADKQWCFKVELRRFAVTLPFVGMRLREVYRPDMGNDERKACFRPTVAATKWLQSFCGHEGSSFPCCSCWMRVGKLLAVEGSAF